MIYKGQLPSPQDSIQRIIPEGFILEPNMNCRKIKISIGAIIQKIQKARDKGYPTNDISSSTKSMYDNIWISYSRIQNKYDNNSPPNIYETLSGFTSPVVASDVYVFGGVYALIEEQGADIPAFSNSGELLGSFVNDSPPGQLHFQPVSDTSRKLIQIALDSGQLDLTIVKNDWTSVLINTNTLDIPSLDIDDFLDSQDLTYSDLPDSVRLLLQGNLISP